MTDYDAQLATLRARFVREATVERVALAAALAAFDLERVHSSAHSLAGRGGMFGFPEISDAAQELEAAVAFGEDEGLVEQHCQALLQVLALLEHQDAQ